MNKRFVALLGVIIAVLMLFGACAVKETEETATASASPEATENPVVAEVNGESIYYEEYYPLYASACTQYGVSEDDETNGSYIRDMIIDSLVNEKIMTQKLTENGYLDLTDEQLAEVESKAQADLDSYIDYYYGSEIESQLGEGYTDEEYKEAKAPYEQQMLTGMGYTKDDFMGAYKLQIAEEAARTELVGEILPTDEEVQAKYDEEVASDKESMEADPTQYESTVSSGATAYYVPAGVRTVRQVLIMIDDNASGAIKVLREQGYDDQADYLLEKALADIKGEADDVLGKLKSGSITFDEAITTYNDDAGMPESGYPVVEGSTTYVESFTTGAMGLAAVGDFTDLVPSDYGYHIIEYFSDVPAGEVSFDSVKDEIYDSLVATMQGEAWQKIVDEWTESSNVVKYEENM